MQQRNYTRLTDSEREEISRSLAAGATQAAIARHLRRDAGTISREIARNKGKSGYRAFSAGRRAATSATSRRQGKSRLTGNDRLRRYVIAKLQQRWSPREIANRIQKEYPDDMTMRISHEAVYRFIYVLPRGALKQILIRSLRQERAYRRKRKSGNREETRGKIVDMLSITERPAEVEERTVPGHWEGDLILGKYNKSALGTLVERTTRYTILVPLTTRHARHVREAYTKAFRTLPREIARTLTYDQGREMSEHAQFTLDTGMTVYFAHPASPWERGTNENTNGLIRQYFPKGTDFSKVPLREIRRVQRELNDRPRAVLDYEKPDEVINRLVALKV